MGLACKCVFILNLTALELHILPVKTQQKKRWCNTEQNSCNRELGSVVQLRKQ